MPQNLGVSITIGAALSAAAISAFGKAGEMIGGVSKSLKSCTGEADKLGRALELAAKKADLEKRVAAGENGAYKALAKVTEQYEKAAAACSKYGKTIEEWEKNRGKMKLRASGIESIASGGKAMIQPLSVGGATTTIGLSSMIKTGMDFEAQMSKVGAVSQASGNDLKRLTDEARHLGATTNWSATEAAQGMEYLAMAGFNVEQTMEAMPGMLELANASGLDLARTSDIASDILTAFKKDAKDMGYVSDVLTNAFTSSNTKLDMLGDTMKYVAPIAATAGVSIEQAAAMSGLLASNGIKGTQAGTALRAMLSRLAAPPKEAATQLEKLGVKVKEANGDLRDMPTILDEIYRAMAKKKYGSGEQVEALKKIFGLEAAPAAAVLTEKAADKDGLIAYAKAMEKTGTTAKVSKDMQENLLGKIKAMNSALQEMQLVFYDKLSPALTDATKKFTEFIQKSVDWAKENPGLVKGLGYAAAAIAGITLVAFPAKMAVSGLWGSFKLLSGAAKYATSMIGGVGGGVTGLSKVLGPLAVTGGPLLLAAGGFAALYANSKDFREIIDSLAGGITKLGSVIGEKLGGALDYVLGKLGEAIDKFFELIGLGDTAKGVKAGVEKMEADGVDTSDPEAVAEWARRQREAHLASGGVVTGPTHALVGEGGEAEAVLPLSKLEQIMGQRDTSGMSVSFAPVINISGGGADAYDQVKRGLAEGRDSLRRELERLMSDQRRLSYA